MRMDFAFVDIDTSEHVITLRRLGKHALDGVLQDAFRLRVAQVLVFFGGQSTRATRGAVVGFGFPLFTGQHDLIRVDDDHMVSILDMGGKSAFVLSTENGGDLRGQAAKHHVLRVNDPPFALDVLRLRQVSLLHFSEPVLFLIEQ